MLHFFLSYFSPLSIDENLYSLSLTLFFVFHELMMKDIVAKQKIIGIQKNKTSQ